MPSSPPSLALTLAGLHRRFGPDARVYVELARLADEAGVDQLVLADHVVMGERTDRYPFGSFPYQASEPWMEPLTTFAAIAAVTKRARLFTGILIAPLRPAVLLAKTVATLDALSGGRVELGVGVGWQREEFDALGVPFERRWSRLDDTLRACRALWAQDGPVSFESPTVRFEGIWCSPRPVQPRLPVWFGARLTGALAVRIAELGDGWYPIGVTPPDELAAGTKRIGEAMALAGRDPSALGVRTALVVQRDDHGHFDPARTFDPVPALVDAGATVLSIGLPPWVETREGARAYLEAVVAARDERWR